MRNPVFFNKSFNAGVVIQVPEAVHGLPVFLIRVVVSILSNLTDRRFASELPGSRSVITPKIKKMAATGRHFNLTSG